MKKAIILFTGGTIAMRTNSEGMLVPSVSATELIESIPLLQKIAEVTAIQFTNIPSAQITPELMLTLRQEIIQQLSYDEISGIVIVHGTDTMEETAFFLDAALSNSDLCNKPVVLTGAMRSADEYSADGAANLFAAVQVAASLQARNRGVMLVMNNEIHAPRFIKKMDTSSIHTFASPHYMPIGYFVHDDNENNKVRFVSDAQRFIPTIHVSRETSNMPRVDIALMYSGADATQINASMAAGAQAIVVQAVGASSVNLSLYDAITKAIAQNIAVVIASRSPLGLCTPIYGYKGGGKTLAELGVAFSHDLPAHKARLYAQLLLNNHSSNPIEIIRQGFTALRDRIELR